MAAYTNDSCSRHAPHASTDYSSVDTVMARKTPVTSPGFIAKRDKAGSYVMGHSRRTSGPGAAAA